MQARARARDITEAAAFCVCNTLPAAGPTHVRVGPATPSAVHVRRFQIQEFEMHLPHLSACTEQRRIVIRGRACDRDSYRPINSVLNTILSNSRLCLRRQTCHFVETIEVQTHQHLMHYMHSQAQHTTQKKISYFEARWLRLICQSSS